MSDFEDQERRLISLGLSLAATYCDLAETAVVQRSRSRMLVLTGRARKEVVTILRRLPQAKRKTTLDTNKIKSTLTVLEERIQALELEAA